MITTQGSAALLSLAGKKHFRIKLRDFEGWALADDSADHLLMLKVNEPELCQASDKDTKSCTAIFVGF